MRVIVHPPSQSTTAVSCPWDWASSQGLYYICTAANPLPKIFSTLDKKKNLFIFTFQQLLIFEDYKHTPWAFLSNSVSSSVPWQAIPCSEPCCSPLNLPQIHLKYLRPAILIQLPLDRASYGGKTNSCFAASTPAFKSQHETWGFFNSTLLLNCVQLLIHPTESFLKEPALHHLFHKHYLAVNSSTLY